MQQLNKEELQTQRQKTSQQQSAFFAVDTKLAALKKLEKIIYGFYIVCVILHTVLFISDMILSQTFDAQALTLELLKFLIKLLWMLAFLNSQKSKEWRPYIILYATAASNLGQLLNDRTHLIESILLLPYWTSGYMLLYGSLILLDIIFPLLPLIAATCLMVISKHHEESNGAE